MRKKLTVLLLLPSIAGLLVFYVVPFFSSLRHAFLSDVFNGRWVGLENFRLLLGSEMFRLAIKNTFAFTAVAVPLIMLASTVLSFAIARLMPRAALVKNAFFLPVLLPSATIVFVWQAYFSAASPFASLLVIYLWKYMGLNIVLTLTALTGVERGMLEAARMDGSGYLRTSLLVTLPNIMPTLLFTLVLSFVNSFKIYRESYLLWGNYPDKSVYMLQNYLNNHFLKLNYQNLSTAAILFFIVIYFVVALLLRGERRLGERIW